jgi:hypothetical protein
MNLSSFCHSMLSVILFCSLCSFIFHLVVRVCEQQMSGVSLNSSCVLFSGSSPVVAVVNEDVKWLDIITFLKLECMPVMKYKPSLLSLLFNEIFFILQLHSVLYQNRNDCQKDTPFRPVDICWNWCEYIRGTCYCRPVQETGLPSRRQTYTGTFWCQTALLQRISVLRLDCHVCRGHKRLDP